MKLNVLRCLLSEEPIMEVLILHPPPLPHREREPIASIKDDDEVVLDVGSKFKLWVPYCHLVPIRGGETCME